MLRHLLLYCVKFEVRKNLNGLKYPMKETCEMTLLSLLNTYLLIFQ
ncbi:hypothetical protein AB205_0146100 [Aquarana catesbeiana]|uniref:Uncharacterized protein n=1 Tax=Aquarana catesbeiana TaxID=8400 RepID=A0A2G9QHR7_AQUCT|nr:hypothetical protein AB205_0146100 [Aquarana catesbeiana]